MVHAATSKFDLLLDITTRSDEIGGFWEYDPGLFDSSDLKDLHQRLEFAIEALSHRDVSTVEGALDWIESMAARRRTDELTAISSRNRQLLTLGRRKKAR